VERFELDLNISRQCDTADETERFNDRWFCEPAPMQNTCTIDKEPYDFAYPALQLGHLVAVKRIACIFSADVEHGRHGEFELKTSYNVFKLRRETMSVAGDARNAAEFPSVALMNLIVFYVF
jgi:hypothetical protein